MLITKPCSDEEYEQIFRLNYSTFVEEIPQHNTNESKILVDKFHTKNNYLIAKKNREITGMICYSVERPFSLDNKISNLDSYLPAHNKMAEIRLLSVKQDHRNGVAAYKILKQLCEELIRQQIDMAVISGTTRQLSLYQKIGFTPFGALVGTNEAAFQPMYITLKNLRSDFKPY